MMSAQREKIDFLEHNERWCYLDLATADEYVSIVDNVANEMLQRRGSKRTILFCLLCQKHVGPTSHVEMRLL
jgi:hypothetical protein